jgi:vacuolar-type H+-ATPase subunit B/Vma2
MWHNNNNILYSTQGIISIDLHIQIVSSARISIFSGAGVTHNRLVTHAKASTDNEVYTNKNYSN